jgi:hypothetical protein
MIQLNNTERTQAAKRVLRTVFVDATDRALVGVQGAFKWTLDLWLRKGASMDAAIEMATTTATMNGVAPIVPREKLLALDSN